jgi:hypothetical protein
MSQPTKCPNCKADLQANASICEWCNFVINQEGDKSIENISSDLESIIKSMKGIEHPTLLSSFQKNAKISMPIFAIAFLLLAYKVNGWFAIPGLFFLVYGIISLFKKSIIPSSNLKLLKAEFDEKVRNFEKLYGLNNKYKAQIQQYQNEWKNIQNSENKGKMAEWISYGIVFSLFLLAYLIPDPKNKKELENELISSEQAIILKADSLLSANNIDLATKELLNIKSQQGTIELQSKIQLKQIELALKHIEAAIAAGDIDQSKSELVKIKWIKNSPDYDAEQIEQNYFGHYLVLKNATNDKLPADKKIRVEDEFDF